MADLEEVYGVISKPVLSYVEREDVDARFVEALTSTKQIIVYGSSKQGKTALVSKHLPYEDHILISLTPRTTMADVYQALLSKAGVRVVTSVIEREHTESSAGISAKFRALLPLFGGAEAEARGDLRAGSSEETKYEEIPLNLELPQAVADLYRRVGCNKWVILENFHYLHDDVQKQFAFDLRSFQELGIRFVVLGVWRERNRMAQFNGDLLDRTVEVPVEPWKEQDFRRVVHSGERALNVEIAEPLVEATIAASFSSIGVFQELVKHICLGAGIRTTQHQSQRIRDQNLLASAIQIKTTDYAARHERALEAIAAGHRTGGARDRPPLFLPYYLVKVILSHGFEGIANGARKNVLHEWIRAIHHRGDDVRTGDMTNLLGGLGSLQSAKSISPPILAYDSQQRMLQVVDSTFYFYIKNADTLEFGESLQNPLDQTEDAAG